MVLSSGVTMLNNSVKNAIRLLIPLAVRKRLAVWVNQQEWIDRDRRAWWSTELVRDFAEKDVNEYHKFCWAHHLGYAAPYEVASRFGAEAMRPSRHLFFSELRHCLERLGIATNEIDSVFEVGCSLGYQLRYLETDLFPRATVLEGVDIDQYAIRTGQEHLSENGSKIKLRCGDMQELESLLEGRVFDIIICTGVLMYLQEAEATDIMRTMLSHCRVMVAMAGLAHPSLDNAALDQSDVRERDQTFIHNLDRMVRDSGGSVLKRRWDGSRQVEGQTIYFVFATPR